MQVNVSKITFAAVIHGLQNALIAPFFYERIRLVARLIKRFCEISAHQKQYYKSRDTF